MAQTTLPSPPTDCKAGIALLEPYLADNPRKRDHSYQVGLCSYAITTRINEQQPELDLDPEYIGFLGYVHDIGQSINPSMHELRTVELLIKEGYPLEVAIQTMHGQMPEQYPDHPLAPYCANLGYAGKIITLADMSMDLSEDVIPIELRAERIKGYVLKAKAILPEKKKQICAGMDLAVPRFCAFRDELFELMDVDQEGFQELYALASEKISKE